MFCLGEEKDATKYSMRTFKTYLTEEIDSVEKYLQKFEDAVESTHERIDRNGHTFFVPIRKDQNLPNKLIASAFQGDEPAGWFGLLEFVRNHKTKNANVSYLPIMSKETFRSGRHEDDDGINPNHNIPDNPSKEMKALLELRDFWLPLASEGFLDLQEDPYRSEGYAFVWSDTGDLGDRIVDLIGDFYPLFHEPDPPNGAIEGRIESDEQGMFGDYLATLGVVPSVTSETPILGHDLGTRVLVNKKIVEEFLR